MSANSEMKLTKNQKLVHGVLVASGSSLSAYNILDSLRDDGLRAPLQVYRALDKLMEMGLVHRLESLNAFVACSHPGCDGHRSIVFMICENCERVFELEDQELVNKVEGLASRESFRLKQTTVELLGECADCAA
ncbi:MAG: transcriptional repressor [Rhizobiaceae bacterium]|jgi:Fur family zinc uptake transcriptional regulator|nr:transcriptional repressor [Rhizobiaceae bacterium]